MYVLSTFGHRKAYRHHACLIVMFFVAGKEAALADAEARKGTRQAVLVILVSFGEH